MKPINPPSLPKPLAQYSHGILVPKEKQLLFITGQVAIDNTGTPLFPNNIEAQTEEVFKKIEAVVAEAGGSMADIVKVTIFLTDITTYSQVSPIRDRWLQGAKPASTLVEISNTVIKGCDVEIEAVAAI